MDTSNKPAYPRVGVIFQRDAHKGARTLADLEQSDQVFCDEVGVPLMEALQRTWSRDAHVCLYRLDADPLGKEVAYARVSKRSPFQKQLIDAGGRIRVHSVIFDHDLPKRPDGQKSEWDGHGLDQFVETIQFGVAEGKIPEPSAWYTTLHGSRFVYALSEPTSPEDAEAIIRGLFDAYSAIGIELDRQCCDWTRLFRLPRTVRQDVGRAYEPLMLLAGGPLLDLASAARVEVEKPTAAADMVYVPDYAGAMPEPDEIEDLVDPKLKALATKWTHGYSCGEVMFQNRPLVIGEDAWNDQALKLVGSAVGQLCPVEGMSPDVVYALLYPAIAQLQDREMRGADQTDWYGTIWSMICRCWTAEQSQLAAREADRADQMALAREQRAEWIERERAREPEAVPIDDEEAEEWLSSQMIVSVGRELYVRRQDGYFHDMPVMEAGLIPTIRDLGMSAHIPVTEIVGKRIVNRGVREIMNDHSIVAGMMESSASLEHATLSGPAGYRTFHLPIHQLHPALQPRFDERVDEWLRAMAGLEFERLQEWLAFALDTTAPICALNLFGASGAGKGLLSQGLAECFRTSGSNDGRVFGKFNEGLLSSPVVVCDEGVPTMGRDEALPVDQAFRNLVSGGHVVIRGMYKSCASATLFPRLLFTSNDIDIMNHLLGSRSLTPEDIRAIEIRLLTIRVEEKAQRLLTLRGNREYTKGWISPSSRRVVANHIFYLYTHRQDYAMRRGGGRLLVEGDLNTSMVRRMTQLSSDPQIVLAAIMAMLSTQHQQRPGLFVDKHHGQVYILPSAITSWVDSPMSPTNLRITGKSVSNVFRTHFTIEPPAQGQRAPMFSPIGDTEHRARWYTLDLPQIMEAALDAGLETRHLRTLMVQTVDGKAAVERLENS